MNKYRHMCLTSTRDFNLVVLTNPAGGSKVPLPPARAARQ